MKKKTKYILIGSAVFLLLLLMVKKTWQAVAAVVLPQLEGFRATPYWDNKQYSWGYGTRAPGPSGTISRAQAFADMLNYLTADYNYFSPMITRHLSAKQWAAFLFFSYNLGRGNADNLLPNINSGNTAALGEQWQLYNKSGGQVDPGLIERRALEWDLWQGRI